MYEYLRYIFLSKLNGQCYSGMGAYCSSCWL